MCFALSAAANRSRRKLFSDRNIKTGGGNYNERIQGNYVQGDNNR
ncbi:hypothetical protein [Nodularia sp. UHCC 0506]|nr:hypothetical protein [Nodularia sp. UHCC 0506]MEA5517030.1 hypothetical protein [Nodularia sp. UHCC 0506]